MYQTLNTIVSFATLPCLFITGLICNLFQLIIFCLIKPVNVKLFRRLNHYLLYFYWSFNVNIADRFTNLKCHITFKDSAALERFVKHSNLVVANHRYDIDWLVFWLLSDKIGLLGNDKALLKSDLLKVPVIGWGWALCDMIVLKRNWNDDCKNMEKAIDCWLTYENSPLLSYLEGTRFTEAKHAASLQFAQQNNLSLKLKHHLLPRTKGFKLMAKKIRSNHYEFLNEPRSNCAIFNMQVGIKSDQELSMLKVLLGQRADLYIYAELIEPCEIPETDDGMVDLLYDIYRRKDELHENFEKNGKFPDGFDVDYKPRLVTLINWSFWMSLVYGTFFYYLMVALHQGMTNGFTTGSLIFLGTAVVSITTICLAIKYMIDSTKVSLSSNYGISPSKTK